MNQVRQENKVTIKRRFNLAERPDTSVVVARRLIAANLDGKIARQIRAAEEEEKLIKVILQL